MTATTKSKEAENNIINFLKSNLTRSSVPNVENELKKDFVLAKRRNKGLKHKGTKKKNRSITRKEKKVLGLFNIPRHGMKYEDVLPMHNMWAGYIFQVLDLDKPIPECTSKGWENFTQSLYKVDFHGSMLKVVRSKCPSYIGKKGVCVMETRNVFKIISQDNIVTTIPKKLCVFEMYVKNLKITLFGKQLCVKPAERSTKKVKTQPLPDL